jgi:hypothetical protein
VSVRSRTGESRLRTHAKPSRSRPSGARCAPRFAAVLASPGPDRERSPFESARSTSTQPALPLVARSPPATRAPGHDSSFRWRALRARSGARGVVRGASTAGRRPRSAVGWGGPWRGAVRDKRTGQQSASLLTVRSTRGQRRPDTRRGGAFGRGPVARHHAPRTRWASRRPVREGPRTEPRHGTTSPIRQRPRAIEPRGRVVTARSRTPKPPHPVRSQTVILRRTAPPVGDAT